MAIKSFTGSRKEAAKTEETPIKVADYMTRKLITFSPEQGISEVMETLLKQRITGGPVVDSNQKLLGIISDSDLMKVIGDSRYFNMPVGKQAVADYMSKDVETIDADENIFNAAARFNETGHRRFPVIENGKLIGQISRMDVIIAAVKHKGNSWRT